MHPLCDDSYRGAWQVAAVGSAAMCSVHGIQCILQEIWCKLNSVMKADKHTHLHHVVGIYKCICPMHMQCEELGSHLPTSHMQTSPIYQ